MMPVSRMGVAGGMHAQVLQNVVRGVERAVGRARSPGAGRPLACQRWFLRGFTKLSSRLLFLALFSARFSRMDLPAFFAASLLGDFPDIGITPFFACVTRYHTHLYFFSQFRISAASVCRAPLHQKLTEFTRSITEFVRDISDEALRVSLGEGVLSPKFNGAKRRQITRYCFLISGFQNPRKPTRLGKFPGSATRSLTLSASPLTH